MNKYETILQTHEKFRKPDQREPVGWPSQKRGFSDQKDWRVFYRCEEDLIGEGVGQATQRTSMTFDADWASVIPELITRTVALVEEKKQRELEFNLIHLALNSLEQKIQRLESLQTKIIPIDGFAPEPYVVLKPILVVVHSVDDEFEAGWFDANIHFSGGSEEEALINLKGRILDDFDSFSNKMSDELGPGPLRQLAIMRGYLQKKV